MAPWPPLRAPTVENDVTFDHTLYSSSSLFYLTTRKTPNKNKEQKQWPKNRLQRQNDMR